MVYEFTLTCLLWYMYKHYAYTNSKILFTEVQNLRSTESDFIFSPWLFFLPTENFNLCLIFRLNQVLLKPFIWEECIFPLTMNWKTKVGKVWLGHQCDPLTTFFPMVSLPTPREESLSSLGLGERDRDSGLGTRLITWLWLDCLKNNRLHLMVEYQYQRKLGLVTKILIFLTHRVARVLTW